MGEWRRGCGTVWARVKRKVTLLDLKELGLMYFVKSPFKRSVNVKIAELKPMWPVFNVKIFCKNISTEMQRHWFILPAGATQHICILFFLGPFKFGSVLSCTDNEWMLIEFSKLHEFRWQPVKGITFRSGWPSSLWVLFLASGTGDLSFFWLYSHTVVSLSHANRPIVYGVSTTLS